MTNTFSKLQPEECPAAKLKSIALEIGLDLNSYEFAEFMDKDDPLKNFRSRFCFPLKSTLPGMDKRVIENPNDECIYLCGNSLGLPPKKTRQRVLDQLVKWEQMGVEEHFAEPLPAALCDEYGRKSMGRLLGVDPSTVVLMNALTVNLHLLLIAFYRPSNQRFKILIEKNAFPSDRYAMRSQVRLHGFSPDEAVIEIEPRSNEHTIRDDDIIELIQKEGQSIAVVCLSGVQYYTGQKFDMRRITQAGHKQGCVVGWDLAHAVGNVEIRLDDWDVDFACWCTYKYLNSGAGCIAGAYMNQKHNAKNQTRLQGWWSNKSKTRFLMKEDCDSAEGIDGFRLSNPSPIMVACVLTSLEIFDEAGMEALLEKQIKLTGYMEHLLERILDKYPVNSKPGEIITPKDPSKRGNQLSLSFSFPLRNVHEELQKRGVVCDIRMPNVMRVATAPLYNSFRDVYNFVKIFEEVLHIFQTVES